MNAPASATLGPACGDLLRWLEAHAVTQHDGRRLVWHGSAEIARQTGKAAGTLTQQIGQLRRSGHVLHSRRGRIELAHSPTATPTETGPTPALGHIITALVELATDYPEHREGIAAAIAAVSRESRPQPRELRDPRPSREQVSQDEAKEDLSSFSSHQPTTREPRNRDEPFAIRATLQPLVELEQRTNPRAQVTASVARELSQLLTIGQLEAAIQRVLPMVESGQIKTGLGLIVSSARSGNSDLFQAITQPTPPSEPPETGLSPIESSQEPSQPLEADAEVDPDVEQFNQLPRHVADRYRTMALNASSNGFRSILEEHPNALTGAATELWRRDSGQTAATGHAPSS